MTNFYEKFKNYPCIVKLFDSETAERERKELELKNKFLNFIEKDKYIKKCQETSSLPKENLHSTELTPK